MREHEYYINNRWRLSKGLPERREVELLTLEELDEKVDCAHFNVLAHNKLLQGAYRYLNPKHPYSEHAHDYIQALKNKLEKYERTHNLELLVDIRNYAMLEFKTPSFIDAYYECEDDTEHAPLKIKK